MPAGTLRAGSVTAGTWFRASFFGFRTVASISGTPVAVEITPLPRLPERLGEPGLAAAFGVAFRCTTGLTPGTFRPDRPRTGVSV